MENAELQENETRYDYVIYKERAGILKCLCDEISENLKQGLDYTEELNRLADFINENESWMAQFKKRREVDDIISEFKKKEKSLLAKIGIIKVDVDKTVRDLVEKCMELSEEIKEYARSIRPEKLGTAEEKPKIAAILREYIKSEDEINIYKFKDILDSLESASEVLGAEYSDELFEINMLLEEAAENPSVMPINLSKSKLIFRSLIPKIRKEWDISTEEVEGKYPTLEKPDYTAIIFQIKNLKEIMEEETSKNVISALGDLTQNLYYIGLEESAAEGKGYQSILRKRHKATQPLEPQYRELLREYLIELEEKIRKLTK